MSETDPEARFMKQAGGGYAPSHNLQISTDAAHGLIVGVGVTQSANDEGQLPPALDEVQRNLGRLPQQAVADVGYTTRETILEMAERQVDFIGGRVEAGQRSRPRPGIDAAFRAEAFTYEAERDTYRCPAGKELLRRGIQRTRVGVLHHVYQAKAADCEGCVFRPQCCAGAAARRIFRAENVPVVAAFVAKMQTAAAQAIYRLRAAVAEFRHCPQGWPGARRFVVIRRPVPEEPSAQLTLFQMGGYSYQVLVTNLALTPLHLWRFYNQRGCAELIIRELKDAYALGKIPTQDFAANEAFFQIVLLAYNLLNWFKRLCVPPHLQRATLQRLRQCLFLVPAQLMRPDGVPTLRLAPSYPWAFDFLETLRRIRQMRPPF